MSAIENRNKLSLQSLLREYGPTFLLAGVEIGVANITYALLRDPALTGLVFLSENAMAISLWLDIHPKNKPATSSS